MTTSSVEGNGYINGRGPDEPVVQLSNLKKDNSSYGIVTFVSGLPSAFLDKNPGEDADTDRSIRRRGESR